MHRMASKQMLFWGFASFGLAAFGQQADHPVISEVRFYQHKDVNEEFVELYNPTCREVRLHNWKITYKSKTGTDWHNKMVFGPNHILKPHGFFLWGGDRVTTNPDTVETSAQAIGLSNTAGHVALCDTGGAIIDKVAWGGGDSPEGTAINAKHVEGGSIERKADAASTALSMSTGGRTSLQATGTIPKTTTMISSFTTILQKPIPRIPIPPWNRNCPTVSAAAPARYFLPPSPSSTRFRSVFQSARIAPPR